MRQPKYKILISAYACAPNMGSEPGMGWNFVLGLSKYHEVHVITEKEKWEDPISDYLKDSENRNLNFYFLKKERNKKLRKIWPPSYYWFYKKWQKKALDLSSKLDLEEDFDIIHQLNMVGFREPGYLYKINKPYVWGPIGGLDNSPWSFIPSLGIKGALFYTFRNLINSYQKKYLKRPMLAAKHPQSRFLAATSSGRKFIKDNWKKDAQILNEVGSYRNDASKEIERRGEEVPLKIIWSGLHIPRKNLPLLLYALENFQYPFELHILGDGDKRESWEEIAKSLGINGMCHWHGWLDRFDSLKIVERGHVFCITSISDEASTVVLEALSFGVPVICLDHCGFGEVVTNSCGIKIPVNKPSDAIVDFNNALKSIYEDENLRYQLAMNSLIRAKKYNWEEKILKLNSIYNDLLNDEE